MKIISPHVYTWESEPAEERPSAFAATGDWQRSGFYAVADPSRRARSRRRLGFRPLLAFAVAMLVLVAFAIERFAPLLRA